MTSAQKIEIALRAGMLASTILDIQRRDDGHVMKLIMSSAIEQFTELDKKIVEASK